MPKQVELKVVVGERSGGVHLNDIMTIGSVTGKVVKIEPKERWCFFTLRTDTVSGTYTSCNQSTTVHVTAGNVRRKLPMDSEVSVTREVPTEQEARSEALARVAKSAHESYDQARENLKRQFRKLTLDTQKRASDADWYYAFSLDAAGQVAKAQEEFNVWKRVQANAVGMMEQRVHPDLAWVKAVVSERANAVHHLTRPYRDALSRSTSTMSNISEDMELVALANFIDETKWDKPEEVLAGE